MVPRFWWTQAVSSNEMDHVMHVFIIMDILL